VHVTTSTQFQTSSLLCCSRSSHFFITFVHLLRCCLFLLLCSLTLLWGHKYFTVYLEWTQNAHVFKVSHHAEPVPDGTRSASDSIVGTVLVVSDGPQTMNQIRLWSHHVHWPTPTATTTFCSQITKNTGDESTGELTTHSCEQRRCCSSNNAQRTPKCLARSVSIYSCYIARYITSRAWLLHDCVCLSVCLPYARSPACSPHRTKWSQIIVVMTTIDWRATVSMATDWRHHTDNLTAVGGGGARHGRTDGDDCRPSVRSIIHSWQPGRHLPESKWNLTGFATEGKFHTWQSPDGATRHGTALWSL